MLSAEATLITLRESLEAFLIISILAGLVTKLGWPAAKKHLLWGAAAAFVFSVLAGVLVHAFALGLFEANEEAFEGLAAAFAVAILTYMVFWMYKHTLGLLAEIRKRAHAALDAGRPMVLFTIAFVAVGREGIETVLFFATLTPTTGAATLVLSATMGLLVSAVIAYLVFSGIIQLNLKRFFAVTGLLLIVFAGGLVATAVHEFAETGWLPETATAWDTSAALDQDSTFGALAKALFGYRDHPAVAEVAAYLAYVLGLGVWYMSGVALADRRGVAAEQA